MKNMVFLLKSLTGNKSVKLLQWSEDRSQKTEVPPLK